MSQAVEENASINAETAKPAGRLDGVVIGLLAGFDDAGGPLVVFAANPHAEAVPARSIVALGGGDIGKEIALLFENGDPRFPLIIGRVQQPETRLEAPSEEPRAAEIDGERLVFKADQEIVLRCGQASITLTKAGKIILRGAYLLSRSSGVNRIKGGSVQIN